MIKDSLYQRCWCLIPILYILILCNLNILYLWISLCASLCISLWLRRAREVFLTRFTGRICWKTVRRARRETRTLRLNTTSGVEFNTADKFRLFFTAGPELMYRDTHGIHYGSILIMQLRYHRMISLAKVRHVIAIGIHASAVIIHKLHYTIGLCLTMTETSREGRAGSILGE